MIERLYNYERTGRRAVDFFLWKAELNASAYTKRLTLDLGFENQSIAMFLCSPETRIHGCKTAKFSVWEIVWFFS